MVARDAWAPRRLLGLPRPEASQPLQAALGALALAAMLGAAVGLAGAAASGPSVLVLFGRDTFPDWLAGPFAGLGGPSPESFDLLLLVMCLGYGAALAVSGSLPPRLALGALVVLHLVFLAAPLLLTTDVFGYIDYARLAVVHDLSPYAHGSEAVADDPLEPFVLWHEDPSPYGPLFTLLSYPLAVIDFRAGLWLVKLAAVGASLGCVALVWRCACRLGRDPVLPALLVGLNPVLLVWAVGGAHNDLLTMLLVLVGVERLLAARGALGGAALAAAGAVKATGAIVLPFALVGAGRPGRTLAGAAAGALVVLASSFAVLGADVLAGYPGAVTTQQGLASEHSVPAYVGRLLGAGGASETLRLVAGAALLVALAGLLARTWRGGDWLTAAGWATLALLLATAWLMPWYLVWLLPLAALSESRPLRGAALAMTAFVVASRLLPA